MPGAQIQGEGYDEPLALALSECIADAGDLPVALQVMADRVANAAARGVYARYSALEGADREEDDIEDIESIAF